MFSRDEDMVKNPKDDFSESTKYMWEIPKADVVQLCRRVFANKFNEAVFRAWADQDKHLHNKILYRIAAMESQSAVTSLVKNTWYNSMQQRVASLGMEFPFNMAKNAPLPKWSSAGFYALLPALPTNVEEQSAHRFTEVSLLGRWTVDVRPIPPHSFRNKLLWVIG